MTLYERKNTDGKKYNWDRIPEFPDSIVLTSTDNTECFSVSVRQFESDFKEVE